MYPTSRLRYQRQLDAVRSLRDCAYLDAELLTLHQASTDPEVLALRARVEARAATWTFPLLRLAGHGTPTPALPSSIAGLLHHPALLALSEQLGVLPDDLAGDSPMADIRAALERCVSTAQLDRVLDRVQHLPASRPWAPLTLERADAIEELRTVLSEVGLTLTTASIHACEHTAWARALDEGRGTPDVRAALADEARLQHAAAVDLVPERIRAGVPLSRTAVEDRVAVERLLRSLSGPSEPPSAPSPDPPTSTPPPRGPRRR